MAFWVQQKGINLLSLALMMKAFSGESLETKQGIHLAEKNHWQNAVVYSRDTYRLPVGETHASSRTQKWRQIPGNQRWKNKWWIINWLELVRHCLTRKWWRYFMNYRVTKKRFFVSWESPRMLLCCIQIWGYFLDNCNVFMGQNIFGGHPIQFTNWKKRRKNTLQVRWHLSLTSKEVSFQS